MADRLVPERLTIQLISSGEEIQTERERLRKPSEGYAALERAPSALVASHDAGAAASPR